MDELFTFIGFSLLFGFFGNGEKRKDEVDEIVFMMFIIVLFFNFGYVQIFISQFFNWGRFLSKVFTALIFLTFTFLGKFIWRKFDI